MPRYNPNNNNETNVNNNNQEFKGHETFANIVVKTKEGNIKIPFQKLPEGRELTGVGIDNIEKCYRTCNPESQYYNVNKLINYIVKTIAESAQQLDKGESILLSEVAPKLLGTIDIEIYRKGEAKEIAVETATEEDLLDLL